MPINDKILKYEEKAVMALRFLYNRFGYSHYKMSRFEEYDLYVKNKDFLISDGIITFTDTNGKLLALKPDVTLSIINNSKDIKGSVSKLYYNENVYRVSKGTHTYKEIMQTGLECIGDIGDYEICEVLTLALKSLEIIDDSFIMDISHVGFINALIDDYNILDSIKMKIIDCINKKSENELIKTCVENGVADNITDNLRKLILSFDSFDKCFCTLAEITAGEKSKAELEKFKTICDYLAKSKFADKIRIDFSIANDMKYYSGVVFKGYINGVPTGVLSGGQYDKLMEKMGRKSGAIGFAVYLDTLERMHKSTKKYDVDILLIFDGDISKALNAADEISTDGTRVMVCREIPKDIRYKQALKID